MPDPSDTSTATEGFWSCNIDRRGRLIRLCSGLLCLGGAAWLWWSVENAAFWAMGLLAMGVVAAFEGIRGWCILRAFGMKTSW